MKKVNLFIVGAPKSGTTTVYAYLKKHPEVFMCQIKEPHYFSGLETNKRRYSVKKLERYLSLYSGYTNERYLGEASTSYLYFSRAAHEIFEYNSDAKIIIILRNPVDRAYSHYYMDRFKYNSEERKFIDAVDLNYTSTNGFHGKKVNPYLYPSFYSLHVKKYLETFKYRNVYIGIFEKIFPEERYKADLIQFLKLESEQYGDIYKNDQVKLRSLFKVLNLNRATFYPFYSMMPNIAKKYIKKMVYKKNEKKKMDAEIRKYLLNKYFLSDIKELEKIIGQNLSIWYN